MGHDQAQGLAMAGSWRGHRVDTDVTGAWWGHEQRGGSPAGAAATQEHSHHQNQREAGRKGEGQQLSHPLYLSLPSYILLNTPIAWTQLKPVGEEDWSTVQRGQPPNAKVKQKRRENGFVDQTSNKQQSRARMPAQFSLSPETLNLITRSSLSDTCIRSSTAHSQL